MFKRLLLMGALVGGAAYFVRRKLGSGYAADEGDSADRGESGERSATATEQKLSPARTRTDTNPTALAEEARIDISLPDILKEWPALSADEVRSVGGHRAKLAGLIAAKADLSAG